MQNKPKLVLALLSAFALAGVASAQQAAATEGAPVQFNLPNVGSSSAPAAAPSATTPPAAVSAPAPAPKYSEDQLMELWGYLVGGRSGLSEMQFSEENITSISRGLRRALNRDEPQLDAQAALQQLQELIHGRQEVFMKKVREQNLADAAAYFAKLKDNKAVQSTASGLRYEVMTEGKGAMPKDGQVLKLHYTGSFINGQVFDSSVQRGEPMEVPLQEGALIPGMTEALRKMSVGSKWRIHLPPNLAYGDEGQGEIPPGATLLFDVELLEAKDAPPAPKAPDAAQK